MKPSLLLAVAMVCLGALPATAGDGNKLYLVQEQQGELGNSFNSDQSAANYTSVGLIDQQATQRGSGNSADLRLSGNCSLETGCGVVLLNQDNTTATMNAQLPAIVPIAPFGGNAATLTLSGTGNATIAQIGDRNTASLSLSGGSDGRVEQTGLGNTALLNAAGGAGGVINQKGSGNTANLDVLGAAQSSVVLTQTGTGLLYATGVQVQTSVPGTITITQSN